MLKELRDGAFVLLGTLVLGAVVIGGLMVGVAAVIDYAEHRQRVQQGCESDDGQRLQLCGGSDDSGFAR